ncbi:ATP-dependent DNA helicase RecG [Anaerococcus hydrogenalis]|uniref:Putative ATP-dependent DNA helicase RecG n=1 Tax=Anaerococcus hydrogenalis ACS-025-V-Sch4 TaxID=879306 RepID=F0GZS6_9FIRM|nr:ATP-dependent DNA helicase RecG [Anaerococcus hydrogenalis]EGC84456.1 putative ATP-dependent DNA helicase RecG [Anaerococcus hydrogenalis ACS-025-V-Sch4]
MDLLDLKGLGKKKKEYLEKLSIYKVEDLYNYYPREYEDRSKKYDLSHGLDGNKHYFEWKIESKVYTNYSKKFSISYLYGSENDKRIKIVYFNDKFSPRKLKLGQSYKFYTKIVKNGYEYECHNPEFTDIDDGRIGNIVPIYPLTKSITNKNLSDFIDQALNFFDQNEILLDKDILDKFSFSDKLSNLKEIHFPTSLDRLKKAKSEIKIIDFLKELIFIYVMQKENSYQDLNLKFDLDKILNSLDFKLTKSQYNSLVEILNDCTSSNIMNRLLCGDVGSGKTIIALIAMIIFSLNSYQSCMMVPTEVLAIQQFEKNKNLIESFGLRVELLTSSTKNKDSVKEKIKNGQIDIVIGTHALIVDDVEFKNLKLIVADEQHRFGVRQRQALYEKGNKANYLTMTATPIPRTLFLKMKNLLSLSQITELPKGRGQVITELVLMSMEDSLFSKISNFLNQGRQVYVVSDSINSEDENSVENLYKRYKTKFTDKRIEKLHGKLKADEKENILKEFSDGKIDVLISTTVIEVGIDVSNANCMVIYNANNFGLSSLHQLRGRIGRGEHESFCYLVSKKIDQRSKLNIIKNSNDGFEIAKKDLKLRGAGKILSTIQHGRNLDEINYFNLKEDEIDLCFKIFTYLKEIKFEGVNFSYLEKYFNIDKRIVLN